MFQAARVRELATGRTRALRFSWRVRRVGGRKSHPDFHRVRSNASLMPGSGEEINSALRFICDVGALAPTGPIPRRTTQWSGSAQTSA